MVDDPVEPVFMKTVVVGKPFSGSVEVSIHTEGRVAGGISPVAVVLVRDLGFVATHSLWFFAEQGEEGSLWRTGNFKVVVRPACPRQGSELIHYDKMPDVIGGEALGNPLCVCEWCGLLTNR